MIKFENPYILYVLCLIPFAAIFVIFRFRQFIALFGENKTYGKKHSFAVNFQKRFVLRLLFWSLGFAFLVIAAAGPSWGSKKVSVQKNGNAVCFVFDISYSMLAKDMPGSSTRLGAASLYAAELLKRLEGSTVSAVLAKGSGVLAVPQTEDFGLISSLLANLSPGLLSAPGTDLAAGVTCALQNFPANSSKNHTIVLFTDGDETLNSLKSALQQAYDAGTSVVILGFGAAEESEIITGDNERTAKTALREEKLEETVKDFAKNVSVFKNLNAGTENFCKITYINAQEAGSAFKVLNQIKPKQNRNNLFAAQNKAAPDVFAEENFTVYQNQSVPHYGFFAFLALLFFVFGYAASNLHFSSNKKAKNTLSLLLFSILFTSCTPKTQVLGHVFNGVLCWQRSDYTEAAASFLEAQQTAAQNGDANGENYANFGLAATYLMQNESAAAINRFNKLNAEANPGLQFGSFYNQGIIAYQNAEYEKAADNFKQALLIDSTNLNAKINLELSMQELALQNVQGQNQTQSTQTSEQQSSGLQDLIFSMMMENEQNQWKSQQQENSDILDY